MSPLVRATTLQYFPSRAPHQLTRWTKNPPRRRDCANFCAQIRRAQSPAAIGAMRALCRLPSSACELSTSGGREYFLNAFVVFVLLTFVLARLASYSKPLSVQTFAWSTFLYRTNTHTHIFKKHVCHKDRIKCSHHGSSESNKKKMHRNTGEII